MSDFLSDLANVNINGLTSATPKHSKLKNAGSTSLDMTDFLSIMVAEFQNQDPENAASTTDMLNQLVQMSMIQAITNITDAATMLYTSSLVGKEVTVGTYDQDGKLQEIVGTVTGTGTYNGNPVVFVDGVSYSLSSIMAVGKLPEQPKTDDKTDETDSNEPVGGADKTDQDKTDTTTDTDKKPDGTAGADTKPDASTGTGSNPDDTKTEETKPAEGTGDAGADKKPDTPAENTGKDETKTEDQIINPLPKV